MAASGRQPTRVTIDYAGDQPKKVGVRGHLRSGFRKAGASMKKSLKRRGSKDDGGSPELRAMAADAGEIASILERMQ